MVAANPTAKSGHTQLNMRLRCGKRSLNLARPQVMGVLNVTPDSFSDGGSYPDASAAVAQALAMCAAGAAIIDIGGESTRPGAAPVSTAEELARVLPVLERLRTQTNCVLSVDTSNPEVIAAAAAAGADMINDVRALRVPGALQAVASTQLGVCLMHMQGTPVSMQHSPHYTDVVTEVGKFLHARVAACSRAGIACERIAVDPGFGFGKTLEHNLALLGALDVLGSSGVALLIGVSRKSMFGALLGDRTTEQRLPASLAAAVVALQQGAHIIRSHDVRQTCDALAVAHAVRETQTT